MQCWHCQTILDLGKDASFDRFKHTPCEFKGENMMLGAHPCRNAGSGIIMAHKFGGDMKAHNAEYTLHIDPMIHEQL